jgi:hypothetical protein
MISLLDIVMRDAKYPEIFNRGKKRGETGDNREEMKK